MNEGTETSDEVGARQSRKAAGAAERGGDAVLISNNFSNTQIMNNTTTSSDNQRASSAQVAAAIENQNAKLAPKIMAELKAHWRGADIRSRRVHMANEIFVQHPQCSVAMSSIRTMAANCKAEKRGDSMLVLAGSGAGKTYLADRIQQLMPRDDSGEISKVRSVMFKIPPAPTQRGLASELLRALGDPKPKGTAADMLDRIGTLLRHVETEIIFIDDVQDIPERRGQKGVLQLGNWIRDLIDKSKCLVVLLGTPSAAEVVTTNAQLRRRSMKHLRIEYFSMDKAEDIRCFLRFLSELDKALPLAELSKLDESTMAWRIYCATNGVMSVINKLVTEAVCVAVEHKREALTSDDFERALENLFGSHLKTVNPFGKKIEPRPITAVGEMFHNWHDSSNPALPPLDKAA
ncbi:TniB family NTP-binding protein [Herbaspirillum sp. alder98]|uniref:TniB family NTP-binding protein n=1 Tax=Herbaspirillum sp. alder98 TaxID=2913096 RepID=UPI001CD84EB3|nr:TniB family NTP-binding protein [Herbaspirillum sp. alder98]MCA1325777.1 TniB family NTP-binding protein [Herbaspirillum sp. alder98]